MSHAAHDVNSLKADIVVLFGRQRDLSSTSGCESRLLAISSIVIARLRDFRRERHPHREDDRDPRHSRGSLRRQLDTELFAQLVGPLFRGERYSEH